MIHYRQPVILISSALLIVGFTLTSITSYMVSLNELRSRITQSDLPLTVDNIYLDVRNNLLRPIQISSLMASDTFVRDWALQGEKDPQKIITYLKEIKTQYNTITSFFISEKTHRYYSPTGIAQIVSEDDPKDIWYFRVKEMSQPYEVNLDTDEINALLPTVFINYRMMDFEGNFIGITGVGLTAHSIKHMMMAFQEQYQRNIYLVDRSGEIKISTDERARQNLRKIPGIAFYANEILDGSMRQFSYTISGQTYHVNVRFVEDFNWFILVEESEELTKKDIRSALFFNLIVSLGITLAVVGINSRVLKNYQIQMEKLATTDNLTNLYNRFSFEILLENAIHAANRSKQPLSLILLDLDHFKSVNDQHGHQTGDRALQHTTLIAKSCIRDADSFARWGGEEFMVLLENCDAQNAQKIAESILDKLRDRPLEFQNQTIHLTASLGASEYQNPEPKEAFIKRVDIALYQAKNRGRNQVVTV